MTVRIAPNIKRQRVMVDINGNEVVPYTHEVTRLANEGAYIPTQEEREALAKKSEDPVTSPEEPQAPQAVSTPKSDPLSIQAQIDAAKANLAQLEELKKLKIKEMEAQLELLKSE